MMQGHIDAITTVILFDALGRLPVGTFCLEKRRYVLVVPIRGKDVVFGTKTSRRVSRSNRSAAPGWRLAKPTKILAATFMILNVNTKIIFKIVSESIIKCEIRTGSER